MTEVIYGWMRNLACFFIFMTAVLNCLPDNRYRKYVRFFLGMLLIILLVKPLTSVLKLDQILEAAVSRGLLDAEVEGMEERMAMEGLQEEYLHAGYEAEVAEQVRIYLQEQGILALEVEVELDETDMHVAKMRLVAALETEEILYQSELEAERGRLKAKLEELKNELAEVYQMDVDHIDVAIQG